MRVLDAPPMPSEPHVAVHAAACEAGRDATLLQATPIASNVVVLVRIRFAQAFAGPAIQARYCGNGIKRWTRMPSNRAGDRNHLRNAARIYDDVLFRTELAPVHSPPRGRKRGVIDTLAPLSIKPVMFTRREFIE